MENIILSTDEVDYDTPLNVMKHVEQLSRNIPDDCLWIAAKRNYSVTEFSLIPDSEEYFDNVYRYAKSWGKILYSSMGIHLNGERKIPHIHWVFCIVPSRHYANKSVDRINWLKSNDEPVTWFKDNNWTFVYTIGCTKDKPKWFPLAYPLKEGHYNEDHHPGDTYKGWYYYNQFTNAKCSRMSDELLFFLIEQGTRIYQENLAKNEIRDLCEQKKADSKQAVYDCAMLHRAKFNTYAEMKEVLEIYYIQKLELKDKPCINNYRNYVQAVGSTLLLFRYCDNI